MEDDVYLNRFGKFIGHICGVIALAFTSLTIWAAIKTALNPWVGSIAITFIFLLLAIFFFRTANRLTISTQKPIFSSLSYYVFTALFIVVSGISLYAGIKLFITNEEDITTIILLALFAFICLLFSSLTYKEFKKLKRKARFFKNL